MYAYMYHGLCAFINIYNVYLRLKNTVTNSKKTIIYFVHYRCMTYLYLYLAVLIQGPLDTPQVRYT